MTVVEIAWAAGIFEGEGHCTPNETNKSGISAVVVQKDSWLPERLQELFGGSVHKRLTLLNGKVFPGLAWTCHGARARGFLMTIYPFLSPRRKLQVRTALLRTRHTKPRPDGSNLCIRGHVLTPDNVYRDSGGWRHCRTCRRLRDRARYWSEPELRESVIQATAERNAEREASGPHVVKLGGSCRRGHPFTGENTLIDRRRGTRQCRTCWQQGSVRREQSRA